MGLTIQAPKGLRYLVRAKVQGDEALGLLGVVTFNSQENEKVAEMVLFLDPETTVIVKMDQQISGFRNKKQCNFWIQKLSKWTKIFWIQTS